MRKPPWEDERSVQWAIAHLLAAHVKQTLMGPRTAVQAMWMAAPGGPVGAPQDLSPAPRSPPISGEQVQGCTGALWSSAAQGCGLRTQAHVQGWGGSKTSDPSRKGWGGWGAETLCPPGQDGAGGRGGDS